MVEADAGVLDRWRHFAWARHGAAQHAHGQVGGQRPIVLHGAVGPVERDVGVLVQGDVAERGALRVEDQQPGAFAGVGDLRLGQGRGVGSLDEDKVILTQIDVGVIDGIARSRRVLIDNRQSVPAFRRAAHLSRLVGAGAFVKHRDKRGRPGFVLRRGALDRGGAGKHRGQRQNYSQSIMHHCASSGSGSIRSGT